ncbi:restriction endonuclease subunit S [Burkholderia cenocepacia]|uniref:restriction endonuclease subunit S n=1 Tax=Burkholderia cenocepacia TaxID=95486 RepID=UPI002AB66E4F|nr:restriction endonuclease subunit S [Burkholderia cenocepacia]
MRSEWMPTTWGELATLEYGKAIRDYQTPKADFRVYGTNGPIGWYDTPLCHFPSVIVGRKGAYRGVHYSSKPFFVIDTAFYLKPKVKIDTKWAYYCLLTYDINGMDSGSAIPSTSRDEFYKLPVLLPSFEEQQAVASFLSLFDDRIDLLRQTNATLESITQALFKSWFIDFDPVRAKAEGREPEGMDADTAALFPDSFEDSALGEIPKGWNWARLSDLLELLYGKALKATERHPGSIPVYGSGGVTGFHNVSLVPHGSVIVGRKGTVGSLYWEDGPFYPIDTTFYVRPKNVPLTYCYYAMQRLGLETMNTDAAVPGLNRDNAYRLELIRPTEEIMGMFDGLATSLRDAMSLNSAREKTLSDIRDTLLPRLVSGKLLLPEAEALLNEALA